MTKIVYKSNHQVLLRLILLLLVVLTGTRLALPADYVVNPIEVPVLKSVFGQVQSRDLVPARARIGGTLVEISIEEGDQVESGQVIARIVDEKLALQLNALEANQSATSAQLDNATTNLKRAQQLFARGTIAKSRLDTLQTQADVLTNELRAIEARKSVIVQQSDEGAVIAPAAGRILTVPVTPGSVILPGEPVARIAGGGYFLRLSLPERHAAGIKTGDKVLVGRRGLAPTNGAETGLTGRLVKVYPEIDNGRVIADVEVQGLGDFFVGERFQVLIPISTKSTIGVPPEAITRRHGIDYVTLRRESGPTEISVIPGEKIEGATGALMEILTGLHVGDKVVVP